MDMSWSKEPIGLLCCSMDGTVGYIQLDYEEVGYPLSRSELETFYKLKYSMDLNEIKLKKPTQLSDNKEKISIIENIDVLLAQEQQQEKIRDVTNDSNSLLNTPLKQRNTIVEVFTSSFVIKVNELTSLLF